jgi:hypothetical protein
VDDDWPILAVHDADLEQRCVPGRADEHGEAIIKVLDRYSVANRVQDVVIDESCRRALP